MSVDSASGRSWNWSIIVGMAEQVNPSRKDTATRSVRWQSRQTAATSSSVSSAQATASRSASPIRRTTVVLVDSVVSLDNAGTATDVVRRNLERLAEVESPALCRLVAVDAVPGGFSLTHLCPSGSVSLAQCLGSTPSLTVAQAAAIGRAVADGLESLHAAGLAHGGVCLANILVDASGDVVLAAAGAFWGSGAESQNGATARDVTDLISVLRTLTQDMALPASLGRALLAMSKRAVEPNLDELRAALASASSGASLRELVAPPERGGDTSGADASPASVGDPAALDLSSPAAHRPNASVRASTSGGAKKSPLVRRYAIRERLPNRRSLAAGLAAVAVVVFGWSMVSSADGEQVAAAAEAGAPSSAAPPFATPPAATASPPPPPPSSPSASATPSATEVGASGVSAEQRWQTILTVLDQARTVAFSSGDGAKLAIVNAPGSVAFQRDQALMSQLESYGVRAKGYSSPIEHVIVVQESAKTAVLDITDTRAAYALVDLRDGQLVEQRAARGPLRWRISLRRSDAGWLVEQVTRL